MRNDGTRRLWRNGLWIGVLASFWLARVAWAEPQCATCGQFITDEVIYYVTDRATGEKRPVCGACMKLPRVCALCRLPVKVDYTEVGDGRFLCARDAKVAVLDAAKARQILLEARPELDRLLARFLRLPATNVSLTIENPVHMEQILQSPGFARQCPFLYGYTRSLLYHDTRWEHTVGILSALPRTRLLSTYAHELTHTWLKEELPQERRISRTAVEGCCELVSYRFMESLEETTELAAIRQNNYTEGQIDLFLEADKVYGLGRIVEWMKYGRDDQLRAGDLDRIRDIQVPMRASAPVTPGPPLVIAPTPVPDELRLLGIMGSGKNKVALINDTPLNEGESGTVRVGTAKVDVRCVKILADSVVIRVGESTEMTELKLKPPATK